MKCESGYYSSQGNITCQACPSGYYCRNGLPPVQCSIGEYSPHFSENCLNCPRGFKCPASGLSSPVICSDGYYTNAERQSSCMPCEPGRSCANKNNSEICPAGTFSPSGVLGCMPCGNGSYSLAEASACIPCPAGKSCSDPSLPPQDCPVGYYSNIGDGICKLCNFGYKSIGNGTGCVPCDAGFYCPNPRYVYTAIECKH